MKKLLILGLLAAGAVACTDTFRPPSLVDGFKVIAVRAEPPYVLVSGGMGSVLDAKVVGVPAEEPLCHAWALCVYASSANGQFGCADPLLQVDLGVDATANVSVAAVGQLLQGLQKYSASHPALGQPSEATATKSAGSTAAPEVTVLFGVAQRAAFGGVCPATPSAFLQAGCVDRDRCVIGQRPLTLARDEKDRHENPKVTGLQVGGKPHKDGASVAVSTADLALVPTFEAGAVGGAVTASATSANLLLAWYATTGKFDRERSYDAVPENTWTGSFSAADPPVSLWVVVHDALGGVAWLGVSLTH